MQVVGYERATSPEDVATLLLASDGRVERQPLAPGTDLAYTLGSRHCAGAVDGETHYPCEETAAPYCPTHTETWVCARCTGTCLKDEMDCHQEHAIYLAAFAPRTFKVGVTRRDPTVRLREQGADRAAHVETAPDGRLAREREAEIARTVGDRVRVPTKVRGLHETVDEDAWHDLLAGFEPLAEYAFDYGLDLAAQPVPETLATGTVRGTKGRILVLDRNRETYAVDMRDLVGYELTAGASTRELQASLGSFE
ncbi:MAG: DUF2797 domain-containing protein [Haloarculaceae archaeon]